MANNQLIPEVKTLWLRSLRSGAYKQGQSVLHSVANQQYCCLGVLCDLAVKAGVIPEPEIRDGIAWYGDEQGRSTEELPVTVAQWAFGPEYADTNPAIYREDDEDDDGYPVTTEDTLAEINDNGNEFTYIANLIEEHM